MAKLNIVDMTPTIVAPMITVGETTLNAPKTKTNKRSTKK